MHITDIHKFERLNNNLSINVFELQEKTKINKNNIVQLYISKNNLGKIFIDPLLFKKPLCVDYEFESFTRKR